ncbi:hypothetical protein [Noviluteimonas dokdonensis]|uniref:hypothetical protein n=1 Tax=Noviluteimonas dokdonensis TaxID=414050 RepID=UPI0005655C26|nr:hypothetical protein [Lysobacter dokdonensis]
MHRFQRALCIAILASPVVDAYASDTRPAGEQLVTMQVNGEIEIDPQGRVTAHSIETDVLPAIREVIARAVAGWSFHPPTKDGVPAIARGRMQITLSGRGRGKDYAIRVDNVRFPDARSSQSRWQVDWPNTGWYREPLGAAMLTADIRIAPDGRVLDFFTTQCVVFARKPGTSDAKVCRALESFVARRSGGIKMVHRPGSGEAPSSEPITGTLPIHFQVEKATFDHVPGRWRVEWRTPYRRAPWLEKDAPRIGASDVVATDGLLADSSNLRLLTVVSSESKSSSP